ncbi:MAG: hypothetical protein ACRC5M_02510 [Anaeroplasmataceae bacterium]
MRLTYEEFREKASADINAVGIFSYMEDIIKFYYNVRNQKEVYLIADSENSIDFSQISVYEEFGITFNSILSTRESYVLFIEPELELGIQLKEQIINIPEDKEFTHLVVLSDSIDIVTNLYNTVKGVYPNINTVQSLFRKMTREDLLNKYKKDLGTNNLFDLSEYCDLLSKVNSYSTEYIETFNKIVMQIHQEKNNRIYIYCGEENNQRTYDSLVIDLYLRYGDKFFSHESRVKTVANYINMSLCNVDTMLPEEFLAYIANIPKVLAGTEEYGISFNLVKSVNAKIQLTYIDMESSDKFDSVQSTLLLSDIEVLSVYDFYDIDSIDGCSLMKRRIMDLYKLLDIKTGIIDVTKLLFFSKDNKVFIGFIEKISTPITVKTIKSIGSAERVIEYNDLKTLVPIGVYLNGPAYASRILASQGINYSESFITPKRTKRGLTTLLSSSIFVVDSTWDKLDVPISTIGLFSRFDRLSRDGFYKNFVEVIGLDATRSKIDCFGGFNPKLVKSINI